MNRKFKIQRYLPAEPKYDPALNEVESKRYCYKTNRFIGRAAPRKNISAFNGKNSAQRRRLNAAFSGFSFFNAIKSRKGLFA